MRGATYTILDEPRPGALAHLVVNPFWPLLAAMMAGTWIAGPWFIFNAFAMGSATRKAETWLVIGSVLASLAFIFGLGFVSTALFPISKEHAPYVQIVLSVIKLGFAYAVWIKQERSVALYTYYGGMVRNGALPLVAGVVLRGVFSDAPSWVRLLFAI
jgi:hypothetical protein